MPVQQIVVELVAERLQAGVAGRLAALDAAGQQLLGRGDQFLPASEHLLQQPRAARHRVVDQQVELVVGLLDEEQLQVVRPHVEQTGRRRPQRLADVDPLGLALHVMEPEHVHFGLDRQRQTGDILAAPLLVDLQELGDLGGHGVGRLGRTADRADPVAEFTLFDPARFAEVDQLDPLATEVADLLVADLERLAAPVALAEPPQDRHRHRESQVLVLGDPAFVGKVQVGQRQGVDRHAARLAVGRIAGLLGDVPFDGSTRRVRMRAVSSAPR